MPGKEFVSLVFIHIQHMPFVAPCCKFIRKFKHSDFILCTFLGPLHSKNTHSWIKFWNSIFKKKIFCANKSRFYCLYVKKKTIIYLYFLCLIYNMKDEIKSNSLPTEVKGVFTNATRCIKGLKNKKRRTNFSNSKTC